MGHSSWNCEKIELVGTRCRASLPVQAHAANAMTKEATPQASGVCCKDRKTKKTV
jgi:hypothetical protein